jgi:hypothetical protein
VTVPDAGGQALGSDPGVLQGLRHLGATDMALCQPAVGTRRDDPQLDQPVEVGRLDTGPDGSLCARVLGHQPSGARPGSHAKRSTAFPSGSPTVA